MAGHSDAPFSEMHRAVWAGPRASGDASARPSSPEGVGDTYLAVDTHVLSVCFGTSPTFVWTEFDLDNITTPPISIPPRSTAHAHRSSSQSIDDATPTIVSFDVIDWDDDSYFFAADTLATPSDDIYEVDFTLIFDNSTPTVWTVTVLISDTPEAHNLGVFTVDTNYITHLQYSDRLYLPSSVSTTLKIQVEQSSGGSLSILSGSLISIAKIEN